MSNNDRERVIVRTSIVGIFANVVLASFKAFVGLVSGSIAVILDAVNNLSDALSSCVTIIGTKLAAKSPDKKHPLGYGRIEYISALIVAAIVLYAGITSFTESVKKIFSPEAADYSIVSLIIIASAVFVKIILGLYVRKKGKETESGALEASGQDALFDAVLSFSVLASALVYVLTGLSLEAFVGLVISIFIIKSGFEMVSETVDDIIGKRADVEVVRKIKKLIKEEPEVRGAYDLIITNYGPNKEIASVHIELPDTMSVDEVDKITRRIENKVYEETGIIITGVGVYSYNTGDNEAKRLEGEIRRLVRDHEWTLQLHGFNLDSETKTIRFDVVLSFDIERKEAYSILSKELEEHFGDYKFDITLDFDITDV